MVVVFSGSPTLCEQLLFPTEHVLVWVKGGVRVSSRRKSTETKTFKLLLWPHVGRGRGLSHSVQLAHHHVARECLSVLFHFI